MLDDLLRDMFEDFDIYGCIKAGAYADIYDPIAKSVSERLSKDLSVSQIENIVWESFYQNYCICTIGATKEPWVLDKEQAMVILGTPSRFENLATTIRQLIEY
jgi:hypothetical protein